MASIVFTAGPNAGRRYPLAGGELVMGRHASCQVFIPDLRVSRRHARLRREGARWVVEDLGSRCGTFVNGAAVRRPLILEHGDELALAQSACRVEIRAGEFESDSEPALGEPDAPGAGLSVVDLGEARIYPREVADGPAAAAPDPDLAMRLAESKLGALRSILEHAASRAGSEEIFAALARELLDLFPQAQAACVLAPEGEGGALQVRSLCRRDGTSGVEIPRILLERVELHPGGILLGAGAGEPGREADSGSPVGAHMGAPVRAGEAACGALYVGCASPALRRDDRDLLASIAAQVGLVIDVARMRDELSRQQRLERDLRVARQIQRSLLPDPEAPRRAGLGVAVHYAPAYEIGGDFYDFIWQDASHVAIVVGDVAGKAISAALYMARLTSELRSRAVIAESPSQLLAQVNDAMCMLSSGGMFATLVCAIYDLDERELVLTNAGHVAPLLRREGEVVPLGDEGAHAPPVGVMHNTAMAETRVSLKGGDRLLFTTDGIHEARDRHGTEYGFDRLAERFASAEGDPGDLVGYVLGDVKAHIARGRQGDDITLLALVVE